MESDRRLERRFPVQLPVSFWGAEVAGQGMSMNLSQTGCMVKSSIGVPAGGYLQLQVALPGHDSPTDVGLAVVRWVKDDTFGLQFLFMVPVDHERLTWFVRTLKAHSVVTDHRLQASDLQRKAS